MTGLAATAENIVITRTFSKAYGLAALRVGWLTAPEWMTPGLNMLRGVGNINAVAQAAAAAAVGDQPFVDEVIAQTATERDFLAAELARLDLATVVGLGNFVLTSFPDVDGRRVADFLPLAMEREGIWLRPVGEPGFANHCRIGIGSHHENILLVASTPKAPQPGGAGRWACASRARAAERYRVDSSADCRSVGLVRVDEAVEHADDAIGLGHRVAREFHRVGRQAA